MNIINNLKQIIHLYLGILRTFSKKVQGFLRTFF